ncbi:hypothetical protein CFR73_06065 [Novacetimonas maltaceti]|uniref:Uncharacterized protein n=1 Tax=Novacetimonas maltaceti TaxID=1203393 RepID=A0A2S3VZW1_9PROT|nr:hypothetical protein [Novacetimonas maltaceti]POF62150.1 hypothetical protein KMAL_22510 [Novacetimonas maltaceti]PYD60898.1 hypothetical protein CFR73_06065 [Novacetimonas maltaceti]
MKNTDATATVSLTRTLVKTGSVVAVTMLLMASLRYSATVAGLVDHVAGSDTWLAVYRLTGAADETDRERTIIMGVALVCCLLAIGIVQLGEYVLDRLRRRRAGQP